MGDSSCVIEISGGWPVLTSDGDTLGRTGAFRSRAERFLQGAPDTDDYVIDYDIEATIDGGTLGALGGGEWRRISRATQAFGVAKRLRQRREDGAIDRKARSWAFTAVYDFDTVVASVSNMPQDGETYGIVTAIRSKAPTRTYADSGVLSTADATGSRFRRALRAAWAFGRLRAAGPAE
ncbi:MAG: hypothetical protein ACLTQI_09025 [Slackia sp.]